MSFIKFSPRTKTATIRAKGQKFTATLTRKRGQWNLTRVVGALSMADLANIQVYARELA